MLLAARSAAAGTLTNRLSNAGAGRLMSGVVCKISQPGYEM